MYSTDSGSPPGPKKGSGEVSTCQTREPTMPAITAAKMMSNRVSPSPPRACHRLVAHHIAAAIPERMHRA